MNGQLVEVVRYYEVGDDGKTFGHVCLAVDQGGTYKQVYNGFPDAKGNILSDVNVSERPPIAKGVEGKGWLADLFNDRAHVGTPFGYDQSR